MEVINDDVEPEKELQLGVAKVAPAGEQIQLEEERVFTLMARGTRAARAPAMDPRHRGNKPYDRG